jgi:hypothetical protein
VLVAHCRPPQAAKTGSSSIQPTGDCCITTVGCCSSSSSSSSSQRLVTAAAQLPVLEELGRQASVAAGSQQKQQQMVNDLQIVCAAAAVVVRAACQCVRFCWMLDCSWRLQRVLLGCTLCSAGVSGPAGAAANCGHPTGGDRLGACARSAVTAVVMQAAACYTQQKRSNEGMTVHCMNSLTVSYMVWT